MTIRWLYAGVIAGVAAASGCTGDLGDGNNKSSTSSGPDPQAECQDVRTFFALNVWPTLSTQCTSCHAPGGEASTGDNRKNKTAGFVLEWETYPDFLDTNIAQLGRMVTEQLGDDPKLLLKPLGADDHVGGQLMTTDSPEYKALQTFSDMVRDSSLQCAPTDNQLLTEVPTRSFDETFRRAALTLGGRLPTAAEAGIGDEAAFDDHLSSLLREEGYIRRVKTFFNDVLFFEAGNAVQVNCFQFPTDDYPISQECKDGSTKFCMGLTDTALSTCVSNFNAKWSPVSRALTEEPLEIIANVVRKRAPFSEILTADYTMVNPYTAMLYDLSSDFDAPSPQNYGTWKEEHVETAVSGPYPHAGVLSTPGFLGRWVSTATNRDRGRSRIVYDAFLATNILTLAQRPVDTSALTAVANAPRNAAACSACHATVDPTAQAFSIFADNATVDFDPNMTAATNRHQEMLPPGFGNDATPGQEKNLLAWQAGEIVNDPRFALSVTRIMFEGITGREPLLYPKDLAATDLADRFAAWDAEDRFLHEVASAFRDGSYDLDIVVSRIVKSPFFSAASIPDGYNAYLAPHLGDGRLLTPEILADKITAVFGTHWGSWTATGDPKQLLLTDDEVFYGGIDSLAVTDRLDDPNALMASVGARMANEMACRSVAWDFTKAAADRKLFPNVEVTSVPGADDAAIKQNIAYLIERMTGAVESVDGAEVEAAFQLFKDTQAALAADGGTNLIEQCKGKWDRSTPLGSNCSPTCTSYADTPLPVDQQIVDDPNFTIRSWMAVVSYLASDYRFSNQ